MSGEIIKIMNHQEVLCCPVEVIIWPRPIQKFSLIVQHLSGDYSKSPSVLEKKSK